MNNARFSCGSRRSTNIHTLQAMMRERAKQRRPGSGTMPKLYRAPPIKANGARKAVKSSPEQRAIWNAIKARRREKWIAMGIVVPR